MKSQQYKGFLAADQAPYLGEACDADKNKAMMLSKKSWTCSSCTTLISINSSRRDPQGQFAINPIVKMGAISHHFVEQFKSNTGFEADRHLGQARF